MPELKDRSEFDENNRPDLQLSDLDADGSLPAALAREPGVSLQELLRDDAFDLQSQASWKNAFNAYMDSRSPPNAPSSTLIPSASAAIDQLLPNAHLSAKITVLGASDIGKSHLFATLFGKVPATPLPSTLGIQISSSALPKQTQLQQIVRVWDFSGNPQFLPFIPLFAGNASLYVLVFDKARPDSLQYLRTIIGILNKYQSFYPEAVVVIADTSKISPTTPGIGDAQLQEFLQGGGILRYFEYSAQLPESLKGLRRKIMPLVQWRDMYGVAAINLANIIESMLGQDLDAIQPNHALLTLLDAMVPGHTDELETTLTNLVSQNKVVFHSSLSGVITNAELVSVWLHLVAIKADLLHHPISSSNLYEAWGSTCLAGDQLQVLGDILMNMGIFQATHDGHLKIGFDIPSL